MKELEKIPLAIREKYSVSYSLDSGLLHITRPQPIAIKATLEEIEVIELTSGWMIRFNLGSVSLLKDSFLTSTSIY